MRFLEDQNYADWHDKTFWGVRTKRDAMVHSLEEWERLREKASQIKRHTLTNIDTYLRRFADAAEKTARSYIGQKTPTSLTKSCSASCATTTPKSS